MGIGDWGLEAEGIGGRGEIKFLTLNSQLSTQHSPLSTPYATNPERNALTAACVRSSAHSLFRILRTWVFTVPTVM